MIVKLLKDHAVQKSDFSKEMRTILTAKEYRSFMDVYTFIDIRAKEPHYHKHLDEIYFMLDGYINLKIYDPDTKKILTQKLNANELCVIDNGIHHGIIESSENNRLCVICIPGYDKSDSYPSDVI